MSFANYELLQTKNRVTLGNHSANVVPKKLHPHVNPGAACKTTASTETCVSPLPKARVEDAASDTNFIRSICKPNPERQTAITKDTVGKVSASSAVTDHAFDLD